MEEKNFFKEHTFVVVAYKESEYLEECVKSLLNQTVKSNILISTSTPNDLIYNVAKKYNLEVRVNTGEKGIGPDWNFAVEQAETQYVTLSHQDDLYDEHYLEEVQKGIEKNPDFVMVFTNHKEIRDGKIVKKNINLIIKSILVSPIRIFKKPRWAKRLILKFGNPISCPSVCLNTKKVGKRPYREDMNSNIDWGTWIDFADIKGAFVYVSKIVFYHRIHEESETSNCINSNKREKEDFEMFKRLWPEWFAKFIMIFYKHAEDANKIKKK